VTDLIDPQRLGEPIKATAEDPPDHHVRAALDKRLRALLRHDPRTRSGKDPEDLHQMRVSVRRMRAVLRAARPLLDREWADGLRAELGWLGGALGPVRDLDVLLERLRGEAAALGAPYSDAAGPLLDALVDERTAARAAMLRALASERYTALLNRLVEAVGRPVPVSTVDGPRPELAELVTTEFRRLRKAVRKAGDDPADEVLHTLRIRGKRLRYTTELAEPAIGAPAHELLRATVAMQDVLGEHQDACVAQQRVRGLVDGLGGTAAPYTASAAAKLVDREEVRRAETRAAWPAAWRAVEDAAGRVVTGS
jgi:CHAD domain-containing protein